MKPELEGRVQEALDSGRDPLAASGELRTELEEAGAVDDARALATVDAWLREEAAGVSAPGVAASPGLADRILASLGAEAGAEAGDEDFDALAPPERLLAEGAEPQATVIALADARAARNETRSTAAPVALGRARAEVAEARRAAPAGRRTTLAVFAAAAAGLLAFVGLSLRGAPAGEAVAVLQAEEESAAAPTAESVPTEAPPEPVEDALAEAVVGGMGGGMGGEVASGVVQGAERPRSALAPRAAPMPRAGDERDGVAANGALPADPSSAVVAARAEPGDVSPSSREAGRARRRSGGGGPRSNLAGAEGVGEALGQLAYGERSASGAASGGAYRSPARNDAEDDLLDADAESARPEEPTAAPAAAPAPAPAAEVATVGETRSTGDAQPSAPLRTGPDDDELRDVAVRLRPRLRRCFTTAGVGLPTALVARLRVEGSTGRVTRIRSLQPELPAGVLPCVERNVRTLRLESFAGVQDLTVRFPL